RAGASTPGAGRARSYRRRASGYALDPVAERDGAARRDTALARWTVLVHEAEKPGRRRAVAALPADAPGLVRHRAGRSGAEIGAGVRDVDRPNRVRGRVQADEPLVEPEVEQVGRERLPVERVDALAGDAVRHEAQGVAGAEPVVVHDRL